MNIWTRFSAATLIVAFFGLSPSTAEAATVNSIRISNGCTSDGSLQLINRSSLDGTSVAGNGGGANQGDGCTTLGQAVAGDGLLGLRSNSSAIGGSDPRGYGGSITVQTSSVYSGITLTTPVGYTGGPVETALSFSITGSAGGSVVDGILPSLFQSSFQYTVFVSNGSNSPDIINSTIVVQDNGAQDCAPCGVNAPGHFSTSRFLWDPNQTISVTLGLVGTASTTAYDQGTADADVNLFSTLNFASSNAFILPDGFSVDYAEAGIVDNDWVDPRTSPAPVPLPPGLPLLACAFALLFMNASRRI